MKYENIRLRIPIKSILNTLIYHYFFQGLFVALIFCFINNEVSVFSQFKYHFYYTTANKKLPVVLSLY